MVSYHHVKVTGLIHQLVDLALSEKDYSTCNMLQWFVCEQVEEASADDIVQKLKTAGKDGSALMMKDNELALRRPPERAGEQSQIEGKPQ
ncbi:MAG: ferritin-like domain-containing protein [Archaeoglobaceae archaeon]